LGGIVVDRKTLFNGMLSEDADWIQLAQWNLMACLCENGNEPSGTITPGDF
jgi:hypothetical protein